MKLENPWIAAACQSHAVVPNKLETFLQEQYGQLGEDLILEAVLKSHLVRRSRPLSSLRYLEVGANHPIQTSNTYLFYRKWRARGVLVEANPRLIDALAAVRSDDVVLNFAVTPGNHGDHAELVVAEHSELSSIDPGHVASFGSKGRVATTVRVPTASLDVLLERYFADGIDLLSIDIEGLDLQVLHEARFPLRPACIVAEPSRHYQRDAEQRFADVLGAKGYAEVARTDYNLIYMDQGQLPVRQPGGTAGRPVKTFDIFDTLIARHCVDPAAVFKAVEQKMQVPGFAAARIEAERAVERNEYTIIDIYRELKASRAYSDDQVEALMAAELQEELANVVPIADNVSKVTADAVLVTDMYLPPDTIRPLLRAAGISTALPIVQTSHGKRRGSVWRSLAQVGLDCHHLGDNPQSDHAACVEAGMRPELHRLASPTGLEERLFDAGLIDLPRALRSTRLMTPSAGLSKAQHRLQFELNIPLLTLCATLIRQHALGNGFQSVLFASRDGLHLKLFYDAICAATGEGAPSTYWHTSRIARTGGDPEYLSYCRSLIDQRPLIVDLCGTGASLLRLYTDLGYTEAAPATVLCQQLDDPSLMKAFSQDYGLKEARPLNAYGIIDGSFCPNEDLEILNYVPTGMVLTVKRIGAEWVPLRSSYEFDAPLRTAVESQHEAVRRAAGHLETVITRQAVEEGEDRGKDVVRLLQSVVVETRAEREALRTQFLPAHRTFEAQTRQRLARPRLA